LKVRKVFRDRGEIKSITANCVWKKAERAECFVR